MSVARGCRDPDPEEEKATPARAGGNSTPCEDRDRDCQEWADSGECTSNGTYMRQYCPKACRLC